MTVTGLGRLERVELRQIWVSEASDFTPWLARPKNLASLGESSLALRLMVPASLACADEVIE